MRGLTDAVPVAQQAGEARGCSEYRTTNLSRAQRAPLQEVMPAAAAAPGASCNR